MATDRCCCAVDSSKKGLRWRFVVFFFSNEWLMSSCGRQVQLLSTGNSNQIPTANGSACWECDAFGFGLTCYLFIGACLAGHSWD